MLEKDAIVKNIDIEKVVFNGFGLGHYEGRVILVYQGITGDNVDVKLIHKRGDTYFASITGYNKKSDLQISANCDCFEECGGCDWLNIAYKTQLQIKQQIVEESYSFYLNNGTEALDIVPSPKIDSYRNKIILPVTLSAGKIKTGMYARRSHKVIPHHKCRLHPAHTDDIITMTEDLLTKAKCSVYHEKSGKGNLRFIGVRYSETKKQHLLIIVTGSSKLPFSKILADNLSSSFPSIVGIVQDINDKASNRNLSSNSKTIYNQDYLTEELPAASLNIHYSSFFQVNTLQCINVLETMGNHLGTNNILVDAYSGIGTFGIGLANRVDKVICLEQYKEAVANGLSNIKDNGLTNCRYIPGTVEDTLYSALQTYRADTIVFDPPRKGLDGNIIDSTAASNVQKILYLSCNISTQKRDIDRFVNAGFKLQQLQPFDMFPHTHHIECLAVLGR